MLVSAVAIGNSPKEVLNSEPAGAGCCWEAAAGKLASGILVVPTIYERQLGRLENDFLLASQLVLDLGDDQVEM